VKFQEVVVHSVENWEAELRTKQSTQETEWKTTIINSALSLVVRIFEIVAKQIPPLRFAPVGMTSLWRCFKLRR